MVRAVLEIDDISYTMIPPDRVKIELATTGLIPGLAKLKVMLLGLLSVPVKILKVVEVEEQYRGAGRIFKRYKITCEAPLIGLRPEKLERLRGMKIRF